MNNTQYSENNVSLQNQRLMKRLAEMGKVGALPGGGVNRQALTYENRQARELLIKWMEEIGLSVSIDGIGNITGLLPGPKESEPVMIGSHIDTVQSAGLYDGTLGVLAGLEVSQAIKESGIPLKRGLAVTAFTNEEGCRFVPDMMGSQVFAGKLSLEEALDATALDNPRVTVKEELEKIGFAGDTPCGQPKPCAYLELHVEQGPVLEAENKTIGVVEGVQGISWREYIIKGVSNHAGTTPMNMRHDAGYAASALCTFLRQMTREMGDHQVATVGMMELKPNLINVIPHEARLTIDCRNTDEKQLQEAENRLDSFVSQLETQEGVTISMRKLVRFEPVAFERKMVALVEETVQRLGVSCRRLYSGAGHDAQMMAAVCPTAMIFVPSVGGISHNIDEFTTPADIEAGLNVLLRTTLQLIAH
ncbi:MAG: Zn-dependent hydrolase [bacterium]|nr:Zn-dependent hydrolase [bacterium]